MNPATVTATSFKVVGPGGAAVAGTVMYVASGSVATFYSDCESCAQCAIYGNDHHGGTRSGQPCECVGSPVYVELYNRNRDNNTRPTVISTVPGNLATDVPINQIIHATFSEGIAPATVNATNFTVSAPGGVSVAGVVTYDSGSSVVTFAPAAGLANNTKYTATIKTGITDLSGNILANDYVWTFTTVLASVIVPPTVITTTPANGSLWCGHWQ